MHLDPFYFLDPVFQFVDRLIQEQGDILYMLLVYASIPLIIWILRGGLRRKLFRQHSGPATHIIVIRQTVKPPPPDEEDHKRERGQWPPDDEGGSSFAA
jgi:hypothetical protein